MSVKYKTFNISRMKSIKRTIVILCDSLRRDLVNEANSPTLMGLAAQGCWFSNVRGVFPSTTRTSSACIATGSLPALHGLLGNKMLLEEPAGLRCRSVGDPAFREHMRAITGRTLHVPTLAERVAAHGGACIMSNVSPGAAYFYDPDGYGEVYHRAGSYGPGRVAYGENRALTIASGADGDDVMTERFCARLMAPDAPVVATLWLSEPDHTGHGHALGSPEHLTAIGRADRCVGRALETVAALRARGEDILVMVGSDHGMETVVGEVDVAANLVQAGLKAAADSDDVVVAPNGSACVIGVSAASRERIPELIAHLAAQSWCGTVFHGAALAELGLPHDTPASTLALTMRQTADVNSHGVPGSTWIATDPDERKRYHGHGQHGGLGPFEQSPFLIVEGGGFARGHVHTHPARLTDYAPTILRHLGLPHDDMGGHPLPFHSAAT